uniref:Uncharacterized protein n=1 Tax=viral metagenome TaxID=1070528 RepID=A0A6M3LII9_9ZZZZ
MEENEVVNKPSIDEVRDELCSDFCRNLCPDALEDYYCPDHECPVWVAITSLMELLTKSKK